MRVGTLKPEEHFIHDEPYYEQVANEVEIFDAAYRNRIPVLLKGPTVAARRVSSSTWHGV